MSHVLFVGGPRNGESADVTVDPTPPHIMVPLFDWDTIFRGYAESDSNHAMGKAADVSVTEVGTYSLTMWGNLPVYVYQDVDPGQQDITFHGALNKWALTELIKRNR
jgi:hypothetical protein